MDGAACDGRARRRLRDRLGRAVVGGLALVGAFALCGRPLMSFLLAPLYDRQVVRRVSSPDGAAVAEVELTRGGLGTVHTMRVHLAWAGEPAWLVYQTQDSDFEPPLRWADRRTLVVGLPCDRFGYASNPDDWAWREPRPRRLRVRFVYPEACAPAVRP